MLLVAISVLPLLIMLVYRHPWLLLWSFPIVNLVDVFFPWEEAHLFVGGHVLFPMDALYFLTVIYLGLCVLRQPGKITAIMKENRYLALFLAMVAIYVVFSTPFYGYRAVGEARKLYAFFLLPLLGLMVIKTPDDLRRFVQLVLLTATVVLIVALGFAAIRGSIIRAPSAHSALIAAFATFAMLIHRLHRVVVFDPTIDRVLLFLFAVVAIGSGHRSVWLSFGAGLMLVIWLNCRRRSMVMKSAVLALAVLMAVGWALAYFPEVGERLGGLFSGIVNPYSDNTASWRIAGWKYQLGELRESGRLLFGEGLGSYYGWHSSRWGEVTVAPHNAYVQMVLKCGLFGLTVYGLLVFDFFRRTLAARKKVELDDMKIYIEAGIVNFGAAHVYMLGYDFHLDPLIFFAVAVSAVRLSERRPEERRAARLRPLSMGVQEIPAPMRPHPIGRVGTQSPSG